MAPRVFRVVLIAWIALIAAGTGAAAQDAFGNGDGHFGAFTAPPGISSINIYTVTTTSSSDTIVSVASSAGFAAGDLIILWRLSDFETIPTDLQIMLIDDTGRYELARVASVVGNNLHLTGPIKYPNLIGAGAQVVRVPEFTTVVIPAGSTVRPGRPWDGEKGGIVAFLATGDVDVEGAIDAVGYGFRGGHFGGIAGSLTLCPGTRNAPDSFAGRDGEGIATPSGIFVNGYGRWVNGGGGGGCAFYGDASGG